MKTKMVLLASVIAMLLPGCYFGRSPGAKTAAYAANGALIGLGAVGVATANGDEAPEARVISAVPIALGVAGVLVNLAVETRHPAAPAAGLPAAPAGHGAASDPFGFR